MGNKFQAKTLSSTINERKNFFKTEHLLLGGIMIFSLLVRLRLLAIPLERDEGEYAYMGSLILDGIAPYKEAYNMKFPGTYFMYAFTMLIFGKTIQGIHFGLLLANLLSTLCLYLLVKKLMSGYYGVLAAGVFALSSISIGVYGFAAHASHFVVLAAVAGLLLTYRAYEKNRLFSFMIAGFVLGCTPIMKQPGAVFPLAGAVLLFCLWMQDYKAAKIKQYVLQSLVFIAGGALPLVLLVIYLVAQGVWDKFVFWAIEYVADYASQIPASVAMEILEENLPLVIKSYKFFWILSLPGLVAGFFIKGFRLKALFVFAFSLLSFASVCPGFYFRPHYFILYLPALAVSFAALFYSLETYLLRAAKIPAVTSLKWVAFVLIAVFGISSERNYLFKDTASRISKNIYGINPFAESFMLGKFIKQNTDKNDKIAVFGSEPQLFFYSDRKSATGYIYTYGLMEKHKNNLLMQKQMIAEIEKNKPTVILMVNINFSWLRKPDSDLYIFNWFDKYIASNRYKVIGLLDITAYSSNFITGPEVVSYQPQSDQFIVVFKKEN